MLPDFETLVKEIKSERKDLGWSQKELANRAGVSQSLVAKLEQRMNIPNYKSVRKIYETLERNLSSSLETVADLANPEIVSVNPDDTRRKAAEIMKGNDFSQIPVREENNFVGIVLSKDIGLTDGETRIEKIMKHSIPIIPADTPKSAVAELLKTNNAVLVRGKELFKES